MKKYLFFDTETTGLPKNYNLPPSCVDNWPRLVQLAWIINDENGEEILKKDYIIKPEGFSIPEEVSKIHKITTEKAMSEGEELKKVLKVFASHIVKCDLLVGHNILFDERIVESEMIRNKIPVSFNYANIFCTMKNTTEFCRIKGQYGYKWPNLQELHQNLFNYNFEDAHNAFSDVSATSKCFWELKKLGIINV